jgi:hypothetical protein
VDFDDVFMGGLVGFAFSLIYKPIMKWFKSKPEDLDDIEKMVEEQEAALANT